MRIGSRPVFLLGEDGGLCFFYRLRSDVVRFVVSQLFFAPAVGLVDRLLHALRDFVCIHDYTPVQVSGGTAYGLCQGAVRTEESLFVGIQNRYERNLRQV